MDFKDFFFEQKEWKTINKSLKSAGPVDFEDFMEQIKDFKKNEKRNNFKSQVLQIFRSFLWFKDFFCSKKPTKSLKSTGLHEFSVLFFQQQIL